MKWQLTWSRKRQCWWRWREIKWEKFSIKGSIPTMRCRHFRLYNKTVKRYFAWKWVLHMMPLIQGFSHLNAYFLLQKCSSLKFSYDPVAKKDITFFPRSNWIIKPLPQCFFLLFGKWRNNFFWRVWSYGKSKWPSFYVNVWKSEV